MVNLPKGSFSTTPINCRVPMQWSE
jgi:hypothetical protein